MKKTCKICGKDKDITLFYMASGSHSVKGGYYKKHRKECIKCTKKFNHDWKTTTKGWKYSSDAPQNKKWQKDRAELFAESGNGWWWYTPNSMYKTEPTRKVVSYRMGEDE